MGEFAVGSRGRGDYEKPHLLRTHPPVVRPLRRSSDHEVVALCLVYDEHAWRELIHRHGGAIHVAITRQLSHKSGSGNGNGIDPDDILGKVFEKLLRRNCEVLSNLREPEALRAYLCQIARTVTVDHLRCETSPQVMLSHEDIRDPYKAMALKERYRMLECALETLPSRHREFLELYYGQGLTYRQIADQTGARIGTVGVVLHRARKIVGAVLKENGGAYRL